jgi:uncharacterized protein YuzE
MTGGRHTDRRILEHLVVKRDPDANAAYLALTEIGPGEAVETIPLHDRTGELIGAVDLDADGCVLGIEFLDADHRLPRPREH